MCFPITLSQICDSGSRPYPPRRLCVTEALAKQGTREHGTAGPADCHVPTAAMEACVLQGWLLAQHQDPGSLHKCEQSFPQAKKLSSKVQDMEQLIESM